VTALRHPNIVPPLVIEVEDEHVPAYVGAGWLPEPTTHTPEPHGTDDNSPEEEIDE
jgi:hypothetical protein